MTWWDDDSQQFYERSIGDISNGFDVGQRPSALYLASDLPTQASSFGGVDAQRGGYVELDYGVGGNVTRMTVHAQCRNASIDVACYDNRALPLSERRQHLRDVCVCAKEQHYQYPRSHKNYDELNRLAEARRYDRAGTGTWSIAARQRYRYDSANQRTVKQTLDVNHIVGSESAGLDFRGPVRSDGGTEQQLIPFGETLTSEQGNSAQGQNRTADTGIFNLKHVWPRPRKTRAIRYVARVTVTPVSRTAGIAIVRPRLQAV
jgi:hypothetical protein